jgi:hypothetical protein
MTEITGLAIGLVLGVWNTYRLERDAATLVQGRSLSHCSSLSSLVSPTAQEVVPLENCRFGVLDLPWLVTHWAVRFAPVVLALSVLALSSPSAPLAGLLGFWLGRTGYLAAALRESRRRT